MEDKTALFDMDNTLFDYEGQIKRDLAKLAAPDDPEITELWDNTPPHIEARIELIKSVPGWWLNLPKFEPGWVIYRMAKDAGFKCHILTKGPGSKPHAWAEKVSCIHKHFGRDVGIDIVMKNGDGKGSDKSDRYGRVLVDDYPPYVLSWLANRPRGLAIMPAHSYNSDVKHPNVIRYTGNDDIPEILDALCAAFIRKSGEHWSKYLIKNPSWLKNKPTPLYRMKKSLSWKRFIKRK